jgi:hypothetical protein
MSRREKQLESLTAMEAELLSRLRSELARVVSGEVSLFFLTPEFNPFEYPAHWLRRQTIELAELADEAQTLARALGETAPTAALFRRYLERANNLADHHRLGEPRLARELLAELDSLRP